VPGDEMHNFVPHWEVLWAHMLARQTVRSQCSEITVFTVSTASSQSSWKWLRGSPWPQMQTIFRILYSGALHVSLVMYQLWFCKRSLQPAQLLRYLLCTVVIWAANLAEGSQDCSGSQACVLRAVPLSAKCCPKEWPLRHCHSVSPAHLCDKHMYTSYILLQQEASPMLRALSRTAGCLQRPSCCTRPPWRGIGWVSGQG
jgi:hypothetical protein